MDKKKLKALWDLTEQAEQLGINVIIYKQKMGANITYVLAGFVGSIDEIALCNCQKVDYLTIQSAINPSEYTQLLLRHLRLFRYHFSRPLENKRDKRRGERKA